MPTLFVSGDLLADQSLDGIAHGCNCAGYMGAGIADSIRKRFPEMFSAYRDLCKVGKFVLGDVFPWKEDKLTVFNLATQQVGGACALLLAVDVSVRRMVLLAKQQGIQRIGIPRIGAGIGGLKWQDVKRTLEDIGKGTSVQLVVFETYVPQGTP